MQRDTIAIRWHGRGGQGAITAAKIVATAAFMSGYAGVVMAPTFGTERRGAPVFTSLKISKTKIYDLSPILYPDIVVVLDHLLLAEADVTHGLKPQGMIVLNTNKSLDDYNYDNVRLAVADITSIADEAGLPKGMVNSGIIGSFSKAAGLIDFDLIVDNIKNEFQDKNPEKNAKAAILAYERTVIKGA